jgi:hypothetical protein
MQSVGLLEQSRQSRAELLYYFELGRQLREDKSKSGQRGGMEAARPEMSMLVAACKAPHVLVKSKRLRQILAAGQASPFRSAYVL